MLIGENVGSGFSVDAMNSTGPRPEPCGTPKTRGRGDVEVKPAVNICVRSVR